MNKGEWTVLAIPVPTELRDDVPVYRRLVRRPVRRSTVGTWIAHAIVAHLFEVERLPVVRFEDVRAWLVRYVGEEFADWDKAIVWRVAARTRVSAHKGDIVTRYWGTKYSRPCATVQRPLSNPTLGARVRFAECWADAYRIPILSPMLRLFFEQVRIQYGVRGGVRVEQFSHLDTIGAPKGALGVMFLLGSYSAVASMGTVPAPPMLLRHVAKKILPEVVAREMRRVFEAWFSSSVSAYELARDADVLVDALARAIRTSPKYWV